MPLGTKSTSSVLDQFTNLRWIITIENPNPHYPI